MSRDDFSAINCSRPTFDVVLVNVAGEIESTAFAATVRQVAGMEHRMPTIPEGAFVVIQSSAECAQIGIATETSSGKISQFSAQFIPLDQPCSFFKPKPKKIGALITFSISHVVEVTSEDGSCMGRVTKLCQEDADRLRSLIGPFVPSEMLEVFWSESEIAAIEAKYSAQQRYVEKANDLLQTF